MCKEALKTDETSAAANSDMDTDFSSEEAAGDVENGSEKDVGSTPRTPEKTPHPTKNGNGSQTEVAPDTTSTKEMTPSENKGIEPLQNALTGMHQSLTRLENLFQHQIGRNQNQQKMFDTVYREMKDYKENALLEAIHKPIVHNLIQLYDSFVEVESQLTEICDEGQAEVSSHPYTQEKLTHFRSNLENLRFELEEVLYRMDVRPYEAEDHSENLNRELHKTIETVPTANPDEDQKVVHIYKIGFYWHEKVIRPAEVKISRYTQSEDESQETAVLQETTPKKDMVENSNPEKETDIDG